MQEIESIFENAKNITFTKLKSSPSNKDSKSKHKIWFSNGCRLARQKIHLARRMYNGSKSNENLQNLLRFISEYKKKINRSIFNT